MIDNPYMRRQAAKQGIGHAGRKSEARLAKALKGRAQPASGALEGAKGDIVLPEFLLEAKSTQQASMSLKHDWLLKIAHEAQTKRKDPALSISFVNPDGTPARNGEWVMIPLHVFKRMQP